MKRYSLQRKSYIEVISDNFSETLKSFGGFVSCLAGSGISWGVIRNMDLAGNLSPTDEINMVPGLFLICSVFFAKQMFTNFKFERERFHELALEIDKERKKRKIESQKYMTNFMTEEQAFRFETQKLFDKGEKIIQLQNYQKILNDNNFQEDNDFYNSKTKS